MGLVVVLGGLYLAVAIAASQLPRLLAAAVFALNLGVYLWIWGGVPDQPTNLGSQTIHIVILVGGQTAALLGSAMPWVWPGTADWARWARAMVAGLASYPVWMLVPFLFY